jgi:hypothetical protein
MSIEAMKMALEALELPLEALVNLCNNSADYSTRDEVIAAEAALERLYKARKSVSEAEKQEPVAWSVLDRRTGKHWYTHESKYTAQYYANEYSHREPDNTPSMVVTPLYTAPPQREWVGLTEDEAIEVRIKCVNTPKELAHLEYGWAVNYARAIEAKLKEKNT